MVKPWLEAGYSAVTVDLQEGEVSHSLHTHVKMDIRECVPRPPYVAVFAFPPCTHLAVSGSRWMRDKGLDKLIEALQIVNACKRFCEATGAPYMIENPVSTLSTYWREPDHTFHPADFTGFELSDHYTKKTCLWVGGGFRMPKPNPDVSLWMTPPDDRIHKMPPSEDRADLRSATPMGFAKAVFAANAPDR
jgi:hypothetical protein